MKLSKYLLMFILFLIILISLKKDVSFKTNFYKYVYNTNFNFAYVNKLYKNIFGEPMPFLNETTNMVFNEEITYQKLDKYLDGIVLEVGYNYLVPVINDGIVIFIGEKEEYGKCVIIKDASGIDITYGNLSNININMYDYVMEGSLVGEVDEKLYLIFSKDGEILSYEEYFK